MSCHRELPVSRSLFRVQWEGDLEHRFLLRYAAHVDAAVVRRDELPRKVKADAEAADTIGVHVAGTLEASEQMR